MTHLTPEEIIDAVETALSSGRRAHLDACEHCQTETATVAGMLRDAQAVSAVEPSPLFWDHFSDQVRAAIAADSQPSSRARRWFDWPVLAPVSALAALVLALVASVPPSLTPLDRATSDEPAIATEAADGTDTEQRWAMMFDLVGEVDLDSVVDSGFLGRPGTAERALVDLTPAEQEELVRLLREELRSGG